jgi:DNA-binding MurR/RpiR family transcriptional regulator
VDRDSLIGGVMDHNTSLTDAPPPDTYEGFIRLIHERHGAMSNTYQAIALYLTQNPNDVAVRSVNAIAESCGVHASSFVRFAQAVGYKGFRDVQALFQQRLETAAPGFGARVQSLRDGMAARDDISEIGFLREMIVQDIASLEGLVDEISGVDMAAAAKLMERAETIYLVGQNRSSPVVLLMRYLLTMIGKRCILLDASGGLATHMARSMGPRDVLFAVSFRYYANEVVQIVDQAASEGHDVIAISDTTLSPLAKSAKILFAVPEYQQSLSRSLAAPMCVAQALVVATAARLQKGTEAPLIPHVTQKDT